MKLKPPPQQMDAAGLGGAALGAVFGELLKLAIDVAKTTYLFKSKLDHITETLISLKPKIDSMSESNKDLESASDVISKFVDKLNHGKRLIFKCSKIKPWNLVVKYKYSKKLTEFSELLLWFLQVDVQTQLACDSMKTVAGVGDLGDKMDRVLSILEHGGSGARGGYCDVPGLPDLIVGLDEPLKELKKMLLNNGVSVVVLSAPGGCGKTTLSKMLCRDEEIQGIYGTNTFFVTVSKTASLKDIVLKICQHKDYTPPQFQNDEDTMNQLENLMRRLVVGGSILLVLDDVWSEWESLIEKFNFGINNYKILVTSRFAFPRFVDHTYKLNILNDKDAMTLFRHSALRNDDSSKIPDELINKIVKGCRGFPLFLTVVGRSLYGQHVVSWKKTLKKWSEQSIFHSNQKELLLPLQTSLDALEESSIAKDCYLDLGSFPEDQKIPATLLMDMWVELYGLDDEGEDTLDNLLELSFRNLVNLLQTKKDTIELDGYCNEHYVMQHDLLRELAIYQSSQESIGQRKRLVIEIHANSYPQWWIEQQQPNHVRLLSISTDETFASTWYNMQLPSNEVLILNFRSKNYSLPPFIETMNKLKVIIITNYGGFPVELNNFQLLSHLSNLKRIRLEHVSIPSLTTSLLQLRNLHKISLMMCEISKALASCTLKTPNIFPNLTELEIDYCDDLVEFPIGLCNLFKLKKLSITCCNELIALPYGFGRLVNLEVLRIHSCTKLEELPESICGLQKLRFLDISDCVALSRMPELIGELRSLKTLHMRGCRGLDDLPTSVEDLQELEHVICDEEISYLWKYYENQLTKLKVNVIKEDVNLDWLHN